MKIGDITEEIFEVSAIHSDVLKDVKSKMIKEQHIIDIAELFKILGEKTRVSILAALTISELCVCDIAALLSMSNSAISHQLRVLKQAHIVRSRREGKTVYYRMADGHILQLIDTALEHSREE